MSNQDITFCSSRTCKMKKCMRNRKNIMIQWIPHSFADFEGTDYCMKAKKKEHEDEK